MQRTDHIVRSFSAGILIVLRVLLTVAAASAALAMNNSFAHAENADFWPKTKIGSKVCFSSHEHYGESRPWVSKKGAQAAAIRAWTKLTAWEYGPRWGNYRHATAKRMSCRAAGKRWVCATTARPCRTR